MKLTDIYRLVAKDTSKNEIDMSYAKGVLSINTDIRTNKKWFR